MNTTNYHPLPNTLSSDYLHSPIDNWWHFTFQNSLRQSAQTRIERAQKISLWKNILLFNGAATYGELETVCGTRGIPRPLSLEAWWP